jgi:Na+/melibiose symporter-like transporter
MCRLILFYLLWAPPVAGQSFWNLAYFGGVTLLFNLVFSVMIIPFNALLPEIARTERHRVRISAFYSGAQLIGMILASFAGYLLEGGGYRTMAMVYGGIVLVLFYLPFVGLRERTDQVASSDQSTMLQSVIPYIATEICLASETESMVLLLPAILVSLACYPLVVALSRRSGKWRVFTGSLLAGALILRS